MRALLYIKPTALPFELDTKGMTVEEISVEMTAAGIQWVIEHASELVEMGRISLDIR